ncbi:MAG: DUF5597 domain-containing protein [Verrucomicrobiota bacterium]|jgi:hypothetical protein
MTRKTGLLAQKLVLMALVLSAGVTLGYGQGKPIAQLVKTGGKFTMMVDGKPFIILGGQVVNDSGFPDRMERAWPKLKAMNANAVEYPVYWNEIEREEGQFDFGDFDQILHRARAQDLRVVLLWFGTWKNGAMDWAPNWVKSDLTRFPRVVDSGGKPIRVLSPHFKTTLEADKKAYVAMMTHLRQVDEADRTVILMQVENEPGLLGSIRDYSAEATKLFNGPAPAALVAALKKKPGTWTEVFGSRLAEESFTAYYVSSYIDEIAKAGKQVYPLATYDNAWEGGEDTADAFDSFDRAGESYPSGGPVSHMLDLWKSSAPDIDILSADTSVQPLVNFRMINGRYVRPDNPYWSPEAGRTMSGARAFFYALAEYSAIGFGAYGVDGGAGPELTATYVDLGADYRMVNAAMPAILELQASGKLRAAIADDVIRGKNLIYDRYHLLVRFLAAANSFTQPPTPAPTAQSPVFVTPPQLPTPAARVLVGELGPDEFLIMGFDAAVDFRPTVGSGFTAAQFLKVEEGVYENGAWKTTNIGRTYQGSYSPPSVSLSAQGSIFRVKLMRY